MKKLIIAGFFAFVSATVMAQVVLPHQFQPGQPARSSEVNANFSTITQAVNKGFGMFTTQLFEAKSDTSTAVSAVVCPINTLPISANCGCDYVNGTRNFGVLFSCKIVGSGAVGGCFVDSTYNPALPVPQVATQVQCLGAFAVDGTQMPTSSFVPKEAGAPSISPEKKAEELAAEVAKLTQQVNDAITMRPR